MLDVLVNNGRNKSLYETLNYFALKDNIYIMDNHLAAIWCWDKLPKDKNITLVHIDAHYDLGESPQGGSIYEQLDLTTIPINKLTDYKHRAGYNHFRWDNYIHVFNDKHPNLINEFVSITHRLGELAELEDVPFDECDIWHLDSTLWWQTENNKILNLDIDYFFKQDFETKFELFSDKTLEFFSNWLVRNKSKFDIITIALSPECCGSWENAINMANRILNPLDITIVIEE